MTEPSGVHRDRDSVPLDRRMSIEDRRHVNHAGLLELIDQNNQKHDAAHRRLRADLRELEQQMIDGIKALSVKHDAVRDLALTPVSAEKLVLTPKIVVSIVIMVLSIAGVMWGTTAGLRSDVRDILTQMESEKRVADANAKLLDVNNQTLKSALENNTREMKDAIASVTKRQDLLTLQYNQLSDQLTRLTAQRER